MGNQKYWLGPGVYGTGKKRLNPGDPIPGDWSEEKFKRFSKKIGEKMETGAIEKSATLAKKLKYLGKEIKALKKENAELKERIAELEAENPGGENQGGEE